MTDEERAQQAGTVLALKRPPVRQSVLVRSSRAHTFDTLRPHPGGYLGGSYEKGWALILGRFAAAAGGQP